MKTISITIAAGLGLCASLIANTITVTTAQDQFNTPSGAQISLREAIRDAQANATTTTICFSPSLAGARLILEQSISDTQTGGRIIIDGSTTDGSPPRIISSDAMNANSRLFSFDKRDLQMKSLVLDGRHHLSEGVLARGRSLKLSDVEVTGFTNIGATVDSGGGADLDCCYFHHNYEGLRLSQTSSNEVFGSLFCFHQATAIYASTTAGTTVLQIRNSTFAENSGFPAAVRIEGSGPAIGLTHCSFVDNNTPGLSAPSSTQLTGNLFARNIPTIGTAQSVSIVESVPFGAVSTGFNLTDDDPAAFSQDSDITKSDIIGGQVLVSRLGDYGGKLMCCFPLKRCPAIDGGDGERTFPLLNTDSRGFQRKVRTSGNGLTNIIDIGAVETNPEGTLVVTNNFISGEGSLRDVLKNATGETVHITFNPPITSRTLAISGTLVIDADRNYNLDGTLTSITLTSANSNQAIFECENNTGGESSISFQDIKFANFSADAAGSPRGCLEVGQNGRLALHDCRFENNIAAVHGVVDIFRGRLFANECLFEGNSQIWTAGETAKGGAAIRVDQGFLTIWNSTFSKNVVTQASMSGGAIRMEAGAVRATFKQCTFHHNEASANGGALYAGDSSYGFPAPLILDRCTFANNRAINAAIALDQRMNLEVSNCLFSSNINAGNVNTRPDRRDLWAKVPASVNLSSLYPNWSDSPQASPGLIPNGNLNSPHKLAPLGNWGGAAPTSPVIRDSAFAFANIGHILENFYNRDAHNELGYTRLYNPDRYFSTPGAVHAVVERDEFVKLTLLGKTETDLRVRLRGFNGITWQVETSTDLRNFTPNGQTLTPLGTLGSTINIPLPQPEPSRFFVRFSEVVD